jgi:3-isopropylmalate/(R)-2-methylmalate dehydratase large subunit
LTTRTQNNVRKGLNDHVVVPETADTPAVLFIDLHLTLEVTTAAGYTPSCASAASSCAAPTSSLATMDHSTPTRTEQVFGGVPISIDSAAKQVKQLEENAREFGVELFGLQDERRASCTSSVPELASRKPGKTIVCGDSAYLDPRGVRRPSPSASATTEVGHVLATQCLLQRRPKTFAINVNQPAAGRRDREGPDPRHHRQDWRLRRHGLRARVPRRCDLGVVDGRTHDHLQHVDRGRRARRAWWRRTPPRSPISKRRRVRPRAMRGRPRSNAGRSCPRKPAPGFDRSVEVDAAALVPMVTYGTHPGMVAPINGTVPTQGDAVFEKALAYMGLKAGEPIQNVPVNSVFVGSCTNGRLSDLRNAARVLRGHHLAQGVKMLVVPGSQNVKRAAEAEGLHQVFLDAGAEWRESGCSMCLGMNGDLVPSGQYSISTSNRNFEGRQGVGARTLLASPETAAASAIRGRVTDPREFT